MKRLSLLVLVLAAVVAGAALWERATGGRSAGGSAPAGAPSPACAGEAACRVEPSAPGTSSAVAPRGEPSAPAPPPAPAARAPEPAPPSASPAPAADGAALRAEADRLLAERRIPEAIEALRRAIEAAPTAENHGELGALLYRLTAFREAARHLRAAAELDPGNADRWIALANAYYRAVNPGEAWKAERRAREAEPGLELGRDQDGMRIRKHPQPGETSR